MNPPCLIVVTGPPAAGKSTIAREILVTAPSAILLDRYNARVASMARHAGHTDVAALPDVEQGLGEGRWRALDLPGDLIEVDTSSAVDVSELADVLRRALL